MGRTQANCWFFVSLLQQHLGGEETGSFVDGSVKWDRGLHSIVYITEKIEEPKDIGPSKYRKVERKGCLAPTAKVRCSTRHVAASAQRFTRSRVQTFCMDNMGNAPNADDPVPDLVVEHIIVKKFVYEDDDPPVPETPSPAKSTRSKTKKNKASS